MLMLGQEELFKRLIESTHKAIIIVGESGSGKRTIVNSLANNKESIFYEVNEAKVDDVRSIIEHSNSTSISTIYYFNGGDKMTNQAQNALLKLAEEPPENGTVVIGIENESNLLATIKSRSITYYMAPYTENELKEISKEMETPITEWAKTMARTPGQMRKMSEKEGELKKTYNIANTVVKRIGNASLQNVLTISNQIPVGLELDFTKALMRSMEENKLDLNINYMRNALNAIRHCRYEMSYTNANKKNCIDMLLINIRREHVKWILNS